MNTTNKEIKEKEERLLSFKKEVEGLHDITDAEEYARQLAHLFLGNGLSLQTILLMAIGFGQQHPQWIPVEERLPPFDCIEDGSYRCSQPVLIYDPIRAWIYVGRYESDDLYGNTYWVYGNGKRPTREVCGGYEIDNVTHWMPLPQAPRKED